MLPSFLGFSAAALAQMLILAPSMGRRRALVADILWPACEVRHRTAVAHKRPHLKCVCERTRTPT